MINDVKKLIRLPMMRFLHLTSAMPQSTTALVASFPSAQEQTMKRFIGIKVQSHNLADIVD